MKTIKSSEEISRIFKEGRRIQTPELTLIAMKNESPHDLPGRVAFIAGKKLGNAVWRNRAKRRMRAVYRSIDVIPASYDVIFLARKKVTDSDFQKLLSHTKKAMGEINS